MSSTLKRITTDDFNGMLELMPNKTTNASSNQEAVCMSKFTSNLGVDHDSIENGIFLNQHLTKIYSTKGNLSSSSVDKILLWSADDERPNYLGAFGQYDRLVWAGKFENLGGSNGTVFKHARVNGIDTDGFMFVPSPYHDFTPGQGAEMYSRAFLSSADENVTGYVPAESFRIKLRFQNLQPKTFVPLFGYVVSMGISSKEVVNAMDTMYAPRGTAILNWITSSVGTASYYENSWYSQHYNFPGGISSGTNNIMGYGVSADTSLGGGYTSKIYGENNGDGFSERKSFNALFTEQEVGSSHVKYGEFPDASTDYAYTANNVFRGENCRHSVVYFLYAYDTNGKGMIISCAGEADEFEAINNPNHKIFSYKPTNSYFGDSNKNGYLDFAAPYEITSFLDDPNNDLTDLYNKYDPSIYRIGPITNNWVQDTPYRLIYEHWNDLADPFIEGAGNNTLGWYFTKFGWRQSSFTNSNVLARYMSIKQGQITPDQRFDDNVTNDLPPNFSGTGGTIWGLSQGYIPPGETTNHYQNLQIVAFGDVSNNIDFSNWEDIIINVNTLVKWNDNSQYSHLNGYGLSKYKFDYDNWDSLNNTVPIASPSSNSKLGTYYFSQPIVKLYTGKILDFVFRDVPCQKYFGAATSASNTGLQFSGRDWLGWGTLSSQGPSCLVLRPSFRAQGEIHSFSYGAYHNQQSYETIGGSSKISNNFRSGNDTEYLFPKMGYSYNPINDASNNAGSFVDPNNSLLNPLFMLDDDLTTKTSITKAGLDNAIYISMNDAGGLFTDTGNESNYEINNFSIFIRGITLSALSYHDLKFAIVDAPNSSAQVLFASTSNSAFMNHHISEVPINNVVSFPQDKSAYCVSFNQSNTGLIRYNDIQNAYLKIWADPQ